MALGYIEKGGANISDDSLVISKTKNNSKDQTIRDFFQWGDANEDGLIEMDEFLKMAEEIEPEG